MSSKILVHISIKGKDDSSSVLSSKFSFVTAKFGKEVIYVSDVASPVRNPTFLKAFELDYTFHSLQEITLTLSTCTSPFPVDASGVPVTNSVPVASAKFTAASLLETPDMCLELPFAGGIITLACESPIYSKQYYTVGLTINKFSKSGFSTPKVRLNLVKSLNNRDIILYRSSEAKAYADTPFAPFTFSLSSVTSYDSDTFYFTLTKVNSNNETVVLDRFPATYFTMENYAENSQVGKQSLISSSSTGNSLRFTECKSFTRLSAVEIISLLKFKMFTAIDFTASNGHFSNPKSLHYIGTPTFNDYEQAVFSCCSVIEQYVQDSSNLVVGFGAILPGSTTNRVSHLFALDPASMPSCIIHGTHQVLQAYRALLPTLQFYGPTNFAPFLNLVLSDCQKSEPDTYRMVTILTDGVITDMNETVEAIVKLSSYPVSIIIIGVGNADFTDMNILDGDTKRLTTASGVAAKRDIVQFVPFNEVKASHTLINQAVLE